ITVYAVPCEKLPSMSPSPMRIMRFFRFGSSEETICPSSLDSNISGATSVYQDFIFHLSTSFVFLVIGWSAIGSLHQQRSLLRVVLPVGRQLPCPGVIFHHPSYLAFNMDELGAVVLVRAVGPQVLAHVHGALYQVD